MASLVIVVSAVLVLSCGQTDTQTDRQTHTDADDRYTYATLVGVSKDGNKTELFCCFQHLFSAYNLSNSELV